MKRCKNCGLEKQETEFYITKQGYYRPSCKSCVRKETGEWSQQRRIAVDELKRDTPCKDCGNIYPPYCMEYDHIRNKTSSISRMVLSHRSLSSIKKEIAKTELVCILCHRHRTYSRSNNNYTAGHKKKIEFIWSLKSNPCSQCGLVYHPWQMDFDHINPSQKTKNVAQLTDHSMKRITEEISKCILLCALCHRRKTYAATCNQANAKSYQCDKLPATP